MTINGPVILLASVLTQSLAAQLAPKEGLEDSLVAREPLSSKDRMLVVADRLAKQRVSDALGVFRQYAEVAATPNAEDPNFSENVARRYGESCLAAISDYFRFPGHVSSFEKPEIVELSAESIAMQLASITGSLVHHEADNELCAFLLDSRLRESSSISRYPWVWWCITSNINAADSTVDVALECQQPSDVAPKVMAFERERWIGSILSERKIVENEVKLAAGTHFDPPTFVFGLQPHFDAQLSAAIRWIECDATAGSPGSLGCFEKFVRPGQIPSTKWYRSFLGVQQVMGFAESILRVQGAEGEPTCPLSPVLEVGVQDAKVFALRIVLARMKQRSASKSATKHELKPPTGSSPQDDLFAPGQSKQ